MHNMDKEVRAEKDARFDKDVHGDKEVHPQEAHHKGKKRAKIGKEAKIALTVILILLIGLGAALARRWTGSREESPLAINEEKHPGGEKPKEEPGGPFHKEHEPTWVAAHKPGATVVPSNSDATRVPGRSPADADSWSIGTDGQRTKRAEKEESRPLSPSLLPDERHKHSGPVDRFAGDEPSPSKLEKWEAREEKALRAEEAKEAKQQEGKQPFDPFRRQSLLDAPAATAQDNRAAEQPSGGSVQVLEPPEKRPHHHAGSGDGVADANDSRSPGQALPESDQAQAGARFARGSRYPDPAMPPAEPTSPYAGGDGRYPNNPQYANVPPSPPYGAAYNGGPHHPGGKGAAFAVAGGGQAYLGKNGRRDDGTYEVQPNDTYWVISEKLYGTGAYFKALAEHNRRKIPQEDRLQVGDVIASPEVAQLEKSYPDLCPKPSHREAIKQRLTNVSASVPYATGRTYVTEKGDTLFDIARIELGKASRWAEIYELNRHQLGPDYNYLPPGLQLVLPAKESEGNVTRRQTATMPYQR